MRARTSLGLALGLLALAGCPSSRAPDSNPSPRLLSDVRTGLAERERKLVGYTLTGTTTDVPTGQQLGFRFTFASPNRMRGELLTGAHHVFAFDGHDLAELVPEAGVLTRWDLRGLASEKGDQVLHEVFAPFAPQGLRVPLIPTGPAVKAAPIERAGVSLIEVTADLSDGPETFHFTYDFRPPAMDVLREETRGADQDQVLTITQERCDATLGICLPQAWTETLNGKETSRTTLTATELNPSIDAAVFRLSVPDGGHEEIRRMLAATDAGLP